MAKAPAKSNKVAKSNEKVVVRVRVKNKKTTTIGKSKHTRIRKKRDKKRGVKLSRGQG